MSADLCLWHLESDLLVYYPLNFQETPKLAGTVNWGTATVIGIFAGMLYGGSKEASASVVRILFKKENSQYNE